MRNKIWATNCREWSSTACVIFFLKTFRWRRFKWSQDAGCSRTDMVFQQSYLTVFRVLTSTRYIPTFVFSLRKAICLDESPCLQYNYASPNWHTHTHLLKIKWAACYNHIIIGVNNISNCWYCITTWSRCMCLMLWLVISFSFWLDSAVFILPCADIGLSRLPAFV
jgi:hypothetical protein